MTSKSHAVHVTEAVMGDPILHNAVQAIAV